MDVSGRAEPHPWHDGHAIGALWTCPEHSRGVQSVSLAATARGTTQLTSVPYVAVEHATDSRARVGLSGGALDPFALSFL